MPKPVTTKVCHFCDKLGRECGHPVYTKHDGFIGDTCWNHSNEKQERIEDQDTIKTCNLIMKQLVRLDAAKEIDEDRKARAMAVLVRAFLELLKYLIDRRKADEFKKQIEVFKQLRNAREAS